MDKTYIYYYLQDFRNINLTGLLFLILRCDFRMCIETNEVYFLEINPQCGIFFPEITWGSADYILNHTQSQQQFLDYALKSAFLNLHKRRVKSNGVKMLGSTGSYFLKVSKNLEPGQMIIDLTQFPHHVINLATVESWPASKKRLFEATAISLTSDLYLWLKPNRSYGFENNGITVIKRGHVTEANCQLDDQCRLIATKRLLAGQEAILCHKNAS